VVSLQNPRRVCAQCGEINLPAEVGPLESPVATSPAQGYQHRPTPGIKRAFFAGALPGLVAVGVSLISGARSGARDASWMFDGTLAFVASALLSALAIAYQLAGAKPGERLKPFSTWAAGLLTSALGAAFFAFCYFLARW
jgi:hypothetical protein